MSRTVTVDGLDLTTTYTYDPCTDRLLTEVHDGPELAFYWHDQPVYAYASGGKITHYRLQGFLVLFQYILQSHKACI